MMQQWSPTAAIQTKRKYDDVPDTREYEPINVEGLESMGFHQVGSNAPMYMDGDEEFDDDDSDADDVRLNENDAIVVVAKTEEVS